MDVSIIIVNYKTPDLLLACVKSVYKSVTGCTFEIIVIDNESKDNSKELLLDNFPEIVWIDMGSNSGFGRANNKGAEIAVGEYLLLLNSDTEFFEDSISKTLNHYKSLKSSGKKVGLVGCKIMHSDGRLQPSCNYFWSGIREVIESHPIGIKVLQHWLRIPKLRSVNKYARLEENHEITWLGVPFALIKKSIFMKEKFDENFFMYSEDEELNFRLSKSGYKPYHFAGTGIHHHIGASSYNNPKRDKQIFASKLLFILKTRGKIYYFLYCKILNSSIEWNIKYANDTKKLYEYKKYLKELYPKIIDVSKSMNFLNCY